MTSIIILYYYCYLYYYHYIIVIVAVAVIVTEIVAPVATAVAIVACRSRVSWKNTKRRSRHRRRHRRHQCRRRRYANYNNKIRLSPTQCTICSIYLLLPSKSSSKIYKNIVIVTYRASRITKPFFLKLAVFSHSYRL